MDDVTAPCVIHKPSLPQENLHPASTHLSFTDKIRIIFNPVSFVWDQSCRLLNVTLIPANSEFKGPSKRCWQCLTHCTKPLLADINASCDEECVLKIKTGRQAGLSQTNFISHMYGSWCVYNEMRQGSCWQTHNNFSNNKSLISL